MTTAKNKAKATAAKEIALRRRLRPKFRHASRSARRTAAQVGNERVLIGPEVPSVYPP